MPWIRFGMLWLLPLWFSAITPHAEEIRGASPPHERKTADARAGRIGIYFWGEFPPASEDSLQTAEDDIATLGTNSVRTAISPTWDPDPRHYGSQSLSP